MGSDRGKSRDPEGVDEARYQYDTLLLKEVIPAGERGFPKKPAISSVHGTQADTEILILDVNENSSSPKTGAPSRFADSFFLSNESRSG